MTEWIAVYCIVTVVMAFFTVSYAVMVLGDERLAVKVAAATMFWPITVPIIALVFVWQDRNGSHD